jgi:hypothetical protein
MTKLTVQQEVALAALGEMEACRLLGKQIRPVADIVREAIVPSLLTPVQNLPLFMRRL